MSEIQLETIDALAENFQQWPETQYRPQNPPILVTFEGLLDFYYNRTGLNERTCGVGFQRADGNHSPMVDILEDGQLWWGPIQIPNNAEVRLGLINAEGQEVQVNVAFLKNGQADDFRWMIDMQSQFWYSGLHTTGNYQAKLFIRNGTFFTKSPTKFELDQVIKIEKLGFPYARFARLGKPANIVGAEILPGETEQVLLRVDGQDQPVPNNGKKYEIRFSNMCTNPTPDGPCDFFWWDYHEVKRNDFHHHRDALMLPGYVVKYSVALADGELPEETRDPPRNRHMENTNDAPCMSAGYGDDNGPS